MMDSSEESADEFTSEEREQHKKEHLMHNSLGALLSGLGGKDPDEYGSNNITKAQPPSRTENGSYSKTEITGAPSSSGSSSSAVQQQQEIERRAYKKSTFDEEQQFMDWSDTRKYNDCDVDQEWVDEENRRMDELYGECIITAKPNGYSGLNYYCELCFATMNAIKPLEMHCSGMKHLRKKDIYEKSKVSGEVPLIVGRRKPQDTPKVSSSQFRGDYESPKRYSRERSYDRDRYAKDDPPGKDRYASDEYNRDRYRYANRERDAHRDIYQGRDRYGSSERREGDRWGYPAGLSRWGEEHTSADNLQPYPRDERSSYSGDLPYFSENQTYSQAGGYLDERSRSITAPLKIATPPAPPSIDLPSSEISGSLAGGPAASLLTKLSQCRVKNEMDAELASSVINLLLRSSKEYNRTIGEKSVADLMEQAEIKLGTAKAIKSVRKPVADTSSLDAITLAMNTLRQAKEKDNTPSLPFF